jgi:primosomal protein N''
MPNILEVALPVHLYAQFDYLAPEQVVQPGTRVRVSFNHRELVGVCIRTKQHSEFPLEKLKPVKAVLDEQACIPQELMNLCHWGAIYYVYPLGEVLNLTLPKRLREGLPEQKPIFWQHSTEGKGLPENALKRAPNQQKLHQALLVHQQLSKSDLKRLKINPATVKTLQGKGLIEQAQSTLPSQPPTTLLSASPLTLNEQQTAALEAIRYHQFSCYLLEGITGSGKTEIYLQAVARVIQAGMQALVLVPEIGLTPQTVSRFRDRFNAEVVELHSNTSETEREGNWCAARDGSAQIVIGTRLASLCPMKRLGIIIIDEEHDASFKQQDSFRYSARDLSIYRAKQNNIPILLGSATPSLETLNNGLQARYQHLRLTQRVGATQLPSLEVQDLRNQRLIAGLSPTTMEQIGHTLSAGEQVMVFVNRRGYAPALLCHHCGWTAACQSCDAKLTLHAHPRHLRCHHCDRQKAVPKHCPKCRSPELMHRGLGTEQTEEVLANQFKHWPVIRIDRDSTSKKGAFAEALQRLRDGAPCIAVGTQMLAKGHHLPNITLVVIVDGDQGLQSADFRGIEKLGQLIVQVAGRAGRGEHKGKVMIQSHTPDHPILELLLQKGYHPFARQLLSERRNANLPPYTQLAIFRAESKRPENAIELLELARRLCQQTFPASPTFTSLGPFPALVEKVQDRYRYQLQLTSTNRKQLNRLLSQVTATLSDHAIAKRTRWSLDVDGVE